MKVKGVRVITEMAEKDVTLLTDVDPLFISLVKHGANQQPFRVIKEEKEGGDVNVGMVIQSILLPKGATLESLSAKQGLEWLTEASGERRREFEKYVRLDQMPVEKFDKDSLQMVKLDESGAWAITGKLLEGKSDEKALTLSEDMAKKLMDVQPSAMNMPVAEVEVPAMQVTWGEVFHRELSAFLNTVTGVMEQSGRDAKGRKSDVMNAWDAFGSFLSMSLDSVGEKAIKVAVTLATETEKGGEENMELFKSKEEFVEAVKGIFSESMKAHEDAKAAEEKRCKEEEEKKRMEEEEKKKKEAAGKTQEVQTLPPEITALPKMVEELSKSVKTWAEKMEKLGGELATEPAAGKTEEKLPEGTTKKESVFKGFFTQKK